MRETPKAARYYLCKNSRDDTVDNPQQTIDRADIGWLAGVIDGEGSVLLFLGVRKGKLNNVSPQVIIGNTDTALIDKYVDICRRLRIGVHVSERKPRPGGAPGMAPKRAKAYKPLYAASTTGFMRVKTMLEVVTPYLVGAKAERAKLIGEFIEKRLAKGTRGGANRAHWPSTPYDETDLRLILKVLSHQHSKHTPVVEGMLRDYTRGRGS